jgi:thioredoxin-related protein
MTRSIRRIRPTSLLLVGLLGLACGASAPETETSPEDTAAATEVAWFEGTADEAFAYAKAEGKPLFLYWGAEWCPPCHYLKDKIFQQPDFVERSRDFVAVYLDGDDASAQILGEQLDVQGYPTVMVYSAEGDELLRMPSDVPVSRYSAIMDRALRLDRPVKEILDSVLAVGPAQSEEGDLDVLAYYSWGQDSQIDLPEDERLGTFRRLWEETPAELAGVRARFLDLYVGEAARSARNAEDGDTPALRPDQRAQLTTAMLTLLADPDLCRENVFGVTYGADSAIDLLQPEPGAERTALLDAWRAAAQRFESDEELSTDDRLTALVTSINLARLESEVEDSPLPESLLAHTREHVAWAVGEVSGGSELQTVLSTAAFLLDEVGLAQEARDLLADKLDEAAAPYYFMSFLARLKNDAGETDEALALYRQAWQSAGGRYTRFRWGTTYLRRLMDLSPERAEAIEADSLTILDELLTHDDAFALGNSFRLGQLEKAYRAWNEDAAHEEIVGRIGDRVRSACERYPAEGDDSQQARCAAFLETTS